MKQLTKTYQELRNKKNRKGFTLVELLVVIAILAVLASVSVVGYLGFTTKAKNSNALTELSQAKELIRSDLIDGEVNYYKIENASSDVTATEVTETAYNEKGTAESSGTETSVTTQDTASTENYKISTGFTIQYKEDSSTSERKLEYTIRGSYSVTWDALLKAIFTDLKTYSGTFYVNTEVTNSISSIIYNNNGGKATWTASTDSLKQGEGDKIDNNNVAVKNSEQ